MVLNHAQIVHLSTIFFAEFFGTAILVLVACFGGINDYEFFKPTLETMSVCSGLAPMIVINIFGHVSGAHINPAVSVAAFILKLIDFSTGVVYFVGQVAGSVFGYALMRSSIYSDYLINPNSFCMHIPTTTDEKALIIEIVITFVLILVICGCWDKRNAKLQDSTSLRVGFSVLVLTYIGGPFTGGSMNPARSFGPAFYNLSFARHWIYWIGPLIGSVMASVLYRFAFTANNIAEVAHQICVAADNIESGNEDEELKRDRRN